MKKILIIIAFVFVGMATQAQEPSAGVQQKGTIVHIDTVLVAEGDTTFFKWYHMNFNDSDRNWTLTSDIELIKERVGDTLIHWQRVNAQNLNFRKTLRQGDSLKNPDGNNYFSYQFVKDYIFNNGEQMKRTLSEFHIRNAESRLLE